jgi:hypothetical protein
VSIFLELDVPPVAGLLPRLRDPRLNDAVAVDRHQRLVQMAEDESLRAIARTRCVGEVDLVEHDHGEGVGRVQRFRAFPAGGNRRAFHGRTAATAGKSEHNETHRSEERQRTHSEIGSVVQNSRV